jgi:hypothetical protein
MNELILELAKQAGLKFPSETAMSPVELKFAELIIRECAEQVKNLRVNGYGISGAEIIRKHFRS